MPAASASSSSSPPSRHDLVCSLRRRVLTLRAQIKSLQASQTDHRQQAWTHDLRLAHEQRRRAAELEEVSRLEGELQQVCLEAAAAQRALEELDEEAGLAAELDGLPEPTAFGDDEGETSDDVAAEED